MPRLGKSTNKQLKAPSHCRVACALICVAIVVQGGWFANGLPTTGVNLFQSPNKMPSLSDDKLEQSAERSFQQFIQSTPESTLVGKLKPNASEFDLLLLKNKIANSILNMQDSERVGHYQSKDHNAAECYIEVTMVQRIAGKCQKVNNGLPICQSENYMAINPDCS